MRVDGDGACADEAHEQARRAAFGHVDQLRVFLHRDAIVLLEVGEEALLRFPEHEANGFRGPVLVAKNTDHLAAGLHAVFADAHVGLFFLGAVCKEMRLAFALGDLDADDIAVLDVEYRHAMLHGRIAEMLCGMRDVLEFRLLAFDADDAAVVVHTEEDDSSARVGERDHLPGDLHPGGDASLELRRESFAFLDPCHQFVVSHGRVLQYEEKPRFGQWRSAHPVVENSVLFRIMPTSPSGHSTENESLPMPLLCNYYITYRCNAYCDFCHFGDHGSFRGTTHARTEDVLRNLAGLRRLGVRFVDLTGGEPLLHPDVGLIAAATRDLGMKSSITTNGLLYPKRARELAGKVDLLHFSLDSADAAQHDAMRGIACFDHVIESIRVARALGEKPDILFTVTDDNHEQVEGVYELARSHGLMLLLNPIFSYFREEGMGEAAMAYVEAFARRPMVYLNPSFLTLRRLGGNSTADPLCRAVSRLIVISPENELLLPCYHMHFERLPIGESVETAWNSERVEWHRAREGRHDFCEGCTINCYFEPSFAFPTNRLSLASVPSKIKYGYSKYIVQTLRRR